MTLNIPMIMFYVFSGLLISSSIMVVASRNAVYSVLFLIFGFFNAAGLFLLAGSEFLAMLLVIVYVGAVAVLFLFVVMMLDVSIKKKQELTKYVPVGSLLGIILLVELVFVGLTHFSSENEGLLQTLPASSPMIPGDEVANTYALGRILYTDYMPLFHLVGIILLVAMIGAIVLTLRDKALMRRQSVPDQVARNPQDVLEVRSKASYVEGE